MTFTTKTDSELTAICEDVQWMYLNTMTHVQAAHRLGACIRALEVESNEKFDEATYNAIYNTIEN